MDTKEDGFIINDNGHCRLCKRPDDAENMVACDHCDRWFHQGCAKLPKLPGPKEQWLCIRCAKSVNERETLKAQVTKMMKLMEDQTLEIETRAKQQKKAELHASSMEAELSYYKENSVKQEKDEASKEDVLLSLAKLVNQGPNQTKEDKEQDKALSIYLHRQEMTLPSFYGNAKDWSAFKKMFDYTTEAGKYSNLENLMRLQKALGGLAAKSVQSLLMDPANIPQILERLEKQFGQPKRVYKELRDDIEKIRPGGNSTIVELSTALESLVTHLTATESTEYLNDPRLVEDIISKLNYDAQVKWLEVVRNTEGHKTLKDLYEWIKPRAEIHRELNPIRLQGERRNRINVHQENYNRCYVCKGAHKITDCRQFLQLTPHQRFKEVQKASACFICLRRHNYKCRYPVHCGQGNCIGKHHKLLHFQHIQGPKPNQIETNKDQMTSTEENVVEEEISNLHLGQKSKVFYQIIPVTLRNENKVVKTYAFLDPGSSLTLLEEGIADELDLEGICDPLKIKWTQNVSREEKTSKRVTLKIMGSSNVEYTLADVRTAADLHLPVQTVNHPILKEDYPYLQDLPIESYENAQPRLLIGLDHSHLLYPMEKRAMGVNHPIAIKTKLGWLIFGNIKITAEEEYSMSIREEEDKKMHDMMQKFFALENFGVTVPEKLPESKQEARVKELVANSLNHNGERYEIKLLWKEDDVKLPESYHQAYKRLQNQEQKLKNDEELKQWMKDMIKDYVKKGYARKLSLEEAKEWAKDSFYLPHFIVINKNKTPRKPRLVFDAAAKSKGVSLNSMLLSGPDATTPLLGILSRFREGEIASAGDIQEMFSQVKISIEDQKKQSFLFRDFDTSKEPDVYVMQVMIFGATCSPACAQIVKNHNASLFATLKPKAAEAVVKQHYVDDYIDSFDTVEDAIRTIKDVIDIHTHAGFFIRNFVSNSKDVLAALPQDRVQETKLKLFEDKECHNEKILGVYWNTESDNIQFQLKFDRLPIEVRIGRRRPSKREVLSFIMCIYDPMGLISNLTIHGKILMQELHKETSDWDEEISIHLYEQWTQWLEIIKQATTIQIPRWLRSSSATELELHTFVDASEYAFAAVSYIRGIDENKNTVSVRLMTAKSRVAPIKKLSIPRLELQAALLGMRLAKSIQNELRVKMSKVIFWTDSQTVLSWIYSDHRRYNQFVAHRVGEILEDTTMDQWRYVSTNKNPADEGTKHVQGEAKWLTGPDFLWEDSINWPQSKFVRNTTEEIKSKVLMHHHEPPDFNFIEDYKYSDWNKLVSRICTIKKFTDWIKDKKNFDPNINYEDRLVAERAIIRKAQWEGFAEEMKDLSENGKLTKKSELAGLDPKLNEYELMVSKSRLQKAHIIPLSTREPIVLPYRHNITRLIMRMYHEKYLHQGDNIVLGAVYQKYFVIRSRQVLQQVKTACQYCKLQKTKSHPPQMAVLPKCRMDIYGTAFSHTGVDYFGPFEVIVRRSPEKRWGVIFTCLTTRAVHIELAEKLDTNSFLLCLQNFQNRRGKVRYMYSDNGTNFVGANKELKRVIQEINNKMGRKIAAEMEIQWYFNPPAGPHFGGAWERLIQIIKNILTETIYSRGKDKKPRLEELRSALIQAEFFLNSRPLTHIPMDSSDAEPLTPFHFLITHAGEYVNPSSLIDDPNSKRIVDHYQNYFWNRWKKEYLPTLVKRNKWTDKVEPIRVGDIVLIEGKDPPPGQYQGKWLKGRVIKTCQAADGQVRRATISTINGIFERPATRIAKLDVKGREEDEEGKKNDDTTKSTDNDINKTPQNNNNTKGRVNHHEKFMKTLQNNEPQPTMKKTFEAKKMQQKSATSIVKSKEIHFVNIHTEELSSLSEPIQSKKRMIEEVGTATQGSSIMKKAKINFNNWGKHYKLDMDKVKKIKQDLMEGEPRIKKRKRTIAPCIWAGNGLTATTKYCKFDNKKVEELKKEREYRQSVKADHKKPIKPIIKPSWYMTALMILYIIIGALGAQPSGLIAYDCTNPDVNMTSYSLLDVSSCLPPAKNISVTEVPIQVLQRSSKSNTMVYQCKLIIKRSIRHCGMHSHTSDYERSYDYVVKQFSPEECRKVQISGSIPLTMNAGLDQLKRNQTTRGQTLVVGSVWSSSCSGGTYTTPEYTWLNALVYFEYEISLYNYITTVDHENDQVQLRHGLVCPYSHGQCLDSEDGYSTWDMNMNQRCEDKDFEIIYEGKVNKTLNMDDKQNKYAVYTSISNSHLFSIRTRDSAKICGFTGYSTDHPRIFILESSEIRSPFTRRPTGVKNHDIFTYFNSKITLVENYIGQRLDEVYNTVMTEMCKLDKNLLETKLTLARINPTEFVTSIMKRTGFSAVVAGEVLHVLECKPVYVQPIATEKCYQELPVKYKNLTMFLTPVTRTLQPRGTEIECTPLLPAKFQFGGRWYTFDGKIRETTSPQKLATDIKTKWTYTPLPNLMESGVYDADSVRKMRTMIYDQGDKRVASNIVHKILTGQSPSRQGFHFEALISEKLIDNMINKYWEKLRAWSSWLGNITSTAIGLYMIGRLIKFVVDTIMHGRILYDIYGLSWRLIASFWDTMTSFLTHRNTLKNMRKHSPETHSYQLEEYQSEPAETSPLTEETLRPMVRPVYRNITNSIHRSKIQTHQDKKPPGDQADLPEATIKP